MRTDALTNRPPEEWELFRPIAGPVLILSPGAEGKPASWIRCRWPDESLPYSTEDIEDFQIPAGAMCL